MKLTVTTQAQLKSIVRRMQGHCRSRAVGLWRLGLPHHTWLTWEVNGQELHARFIQGQVRFWVDGERVPLTRLAQELRVGDDSETVPQTGAGSFRRG